MEVLVSLDNSNNLNPDALDSGYILAHDLGTSGNKASLYDASGKLVASSFYGYEPVYLSVTWVEEDPGDWWEAVCSSTRALLRDSGIPPSAIACITFSGQMMGCLPVDAGARPLRRAIIWADHRATEQAMRLEDSLGGIEAIYGLTGHRVNAGYSIPKIMWIRDNEPDIYARARKFLNAKDFIVAKLTGRFATDYSDASGMGALDLRTRSWSVQVLDAAHIDVDKLPDLHASRDVVGEVTAGAAEETGLAPGTPVVIGGGDGVCATAGAGVVREGEGYICIGSSSWAALATGEPILDARMRTFTFVHLDDRMYSPCGPMQAGGGSYNWARHVLSPVESIVAADLGLSPYEVMNEEARTVPAGAERLVYLPHLMGERSPYWNPQARGAFVGLTSKHGRPHMIRAILEGVAFHLRMIMDAFEEYTHVDRVRVIGGGARSELWRQIMADVLRKPVLRPRFLEEATSLGAAIAGGVGVGIFKDFSVAEDLVEIVDIQEPNPDNAEIYDGLYRVFKDTYRALEPIYRELAELPGTYSQVPPHPSPLPGFCT
ncbi:MAG TPA: xylulokinase [Firmicutes bacterium]|nr:xylulokinase [Bacillota bacterium]